MKRILNIVMLLVVATVCRAHVEATIDSVQMVVGEQTCIHLSASVKNGQHVMFPQLKAGQMLGGVEVVDIPKVDTVEASDGLLKVTQHIKVTAWDDSLYYIPAIAVKVNGKTESSKSLALKVLTVEVDTIHPNQFYGPRDVQDNPFRWSEWSGLLWLTFLLMLLYVLCWLALLRLRSKKPIVLKVRIRKIVPPHQKALDGIEKLKKEGTALAGGSYAGGAEDAEGLKAYYSELTDILRIYMQERFGFNAMEMTSAEIIERIESTDEKDVKIEELRSLLETSDLVKFAKYTVNMSESDRNLMTAVNFINETKQENVATEERIEPTITEQQRQTLRMRVSLKWAVALLVIAIVALTAYLCWQVFELTN